MEQIINNDELSFLFLSYRKTLSIRFVRSLYLDGWKCVKKIIEENAKLVKMEENP